MRFASLGYFCACRSSSHFPGGSDFQVSKRPSPLLPLCCAWAVRLAGDGKRRREPRGELKPRWARGIIRQPRCRRRWGAMALALVDGVRRRFRLRGARALAVGGTAWPNPTGSRTRASSPSFSSHPRPQAARDGAAATGCSAQQGQSCSYHDEVNSIPTTPRVPSRPVPLMEASAPSGTLSLAGEPGNLWPPSRLGLISCFLIFDCFVSVQCFLGGLVQCSVTKISSLVKWTTSISILYRIVHAFWLADERGMANRSASSTNLGSLVGCA